MKFLLLLIVFLFVVTPVSAALRINEFSSNTLNDWIEIYNSGTESAQLNDYVLRDKTATNKHSLSGSISGGGFVTTEVGSNLNKDGDKIRLLKIENGTEVLVEEITFGNEGGLCTPNDTQSIGRLPDGGANIVRFSVSTKSSTNNSSNIENCPAPTPTNTPGPTNTPTPSPSQTPSPVPTASVTPKPSSTPKVTPTRVVELIPSIGEAEMVNARMNTQNNLLTLDPTPSVLGETVESQPPKNNHLAIILIVIGLIGLTVSLILLFLHARKTNEPKDMF